METFSALLAICAGNSPVPGEFPAQRPVTQSFDVFFDLHPNERLSKQWWVWWFETPSCPLWRHRNAACISSPSLPYWFFFLIILNIASHQYNYSQMKTSGSCTAAARIDPLVPKPAYTGDPDQERDQEIGKLRDWKIKRFGNQELWKERYGVREK